MFEIAHNTSAGPYPRNEDAFATRSLEDGLVIACVADGVGGESKGDIASSFVVGEFIEYVANRKNGNLSEAILAINKKLIQHTSTSDGPQRVFTTFTGVEVTDAGNLTGVHIGDSRALILRGNGVRQLTDDHTEANRFVREGKLSKEEFKTYSRKNVLESAMGMEPIPKIQEFNFEMLPHDRLLLISDGIYGKISKKEIRDISCASTNLADVISLIFDAVKLAKPDDNFTIVGLEFMDSSSAENKLHE